MSAFVNESASFDSKRVIRFLLGHLTERFDAAIVLGSGLGERAEDMVVHAEIHTADIPGYPDVTVMGHSGTILDATIGEKRALIFQGRIHGYEGYDTEATGLPAAIAASFGVSVFIVTNAAGGLNPLFDAGDLMLITDYIVLPVAHRMGLTLGELQHQDAAACGCERSGRPEELFKKDIRERVRAAAAEEGVTVREGVYGFCSGPTYETRAEIHFLRHAGVDAVGMSTVPELVVARKHALPVIAISCITNKARTVPTTVSHDEVTMVAAQAASRLWRLIRAILRSA